MVRVDGGATGESLIQLRGVDKTYIRGSEELHVLRA